MKARRENNGQINIYGSLPSQWKGITGNYIGGFDRLDDNTLEKEGFYDVFIPEYNKTMETLSDIYFDEEGNIFTYDVVERTDLPSVEEARKNKIRELKQRAREKFSETDWYYIRELHSVKKNKNKKVPDSIVSERENIYNLIDIKEQEINSLGLEEVLNFNISIIDNVIQKIEEIPDEKIKKDEVKEEQILNEEQEETENEEESEIGTEKKIEVEDEINIDNPSDETKEDEKALELEEEEQKEEEGSMGQEEEIVEPSKEIIEEPEGDLGLESSPEAPKEEVLPEAPKEENKETKTKIETPQEGPKSEISKESTIEELS